MIRLIGAELNRLASRRLTLLLALAVIAVVGLLQVGLGNAVAPPSPEEVAVARQGYERDLKEWQQHHQEYEQQCLDSGGSETECAFPEPTEQDYGLAPAPFADIAKTGVLFTVALTMLASYLLAASSIGAEFTTGSIGNWLTFVPRREKVFAAKVVAVAVGSAVLGTVTGLLMIGVLSIITSAFGQPISGVGAVSAMAARGIALAVFAGLVGFCVALLTRYTVAALGVFLGYLLLILGLYIVGFLLPPISRLKRWQLETNVQAFLDHGYTYTVIDRTITAEGVSFDRLERVLGFGASSAYLAVVLVALVVIALLVFRRRDVT